MKDKIFGVLQRVGRSFMLPIAILPVAGLLLGFGSSFTNETTIATYGLQKLLGDGTILHALLIIMNKVGSAVFDNLPLIFAVGVAIGMAKKEKDRTARDYQKSAVDRLNHRADLQFIQLDLFLFLDGCQTFPNLFFRFGTSDV